MARLLDLLAVLIVALVVLLPQPSINAYPAAAGDQANLLRMAALQDAHQVRPGDVDTAVELARAYLDVEQPTWALGTLQPFLAGGGPAVHQVASYAYATVLRPADALREAEAGLAACDREPSCPGTARIRLSFVAGLMRKQVEAGVDPKKDPLRAKQLVAEALRQSRAPAELPKPAPAPEKPREKLTP